jgi:hypothetical protein
MLANFYPFCSKTRLENFVKTALSSHNALSLDSSPQGRVSNYKRVAPSSTSCFVFEVSKY